MSTADRTRIADFLEQLSGIGRNATAGWSRMAYSMEERQAHELFRRFLADYGLTTTEDTAGNSYGLLAGSEDLPALVSGSHLDTVYQGGNFDGAVGIAAAVELARVIVEGGGLRHPLRIVAFAGEEGARFGAPCIGSRLATGAYDSSTMKELRDKDGITAHQAALDVGLHIHEVESAQWSFDEITCFVEVHIEQGRVLEARDRPLGVVHSIGGSTRMELTFEGRADHSGATPMWLRRDALAAASELVLAAEHRAREHATTVATVGRLDVTPNSLTTVPGHVVLALDVRDIDSERQRELAEAILDDAVRISSGREVVLSARQLSDQSPVVLHGTVQALLASAAVQNGTPFITQPSGASHDAAHIAKHVPTGMLFVPCRDGVSHSPLEHAEPERIAEAVDVLARAYRTIDSGAEV